MFRIRVFVRKVSLTGLIALDLRRRLGLSDNSVFIFEGNYSRDLTVPESFARRYFLPSEISVCHEVEFDLLCKGEIDENKKLCLSDERIKELWLSIYHKRG